MTARDALGARFWRRLAWRTAAVAVPAAVGTAVAESWAAVAAGRLADTPERSALAVFAALSAAAVLGRSGTAWLVQAAAARAEAELRARLLRAVFRQPLGALEQQGVGELMARVDEDPRELTRLAGLLGGQVLQAVLAVLAAWWVAGATWWPAWLLFPAVAAVVLLLVRRRSRGLRRAQQAAERATAEHASQLEEAIAARDDLRTALGRPFAVRRYAALAAEATRSRAAASLLVARVVLVSEAALLGLVATVAAGGAFAVAGGSLAVGGLVTVWLLATGFITRLGSLARTLPNVETGLGTLARVRDLLTSAAEREGGLPLPAGHGATLELRELVVTYDAPAGRRPGGHDEDVGAGAAPFTLGPVTLTVPAGTVCALVGRTGSGKSTLVKALCRAVEPPPGTVLLDGRDVTETDLQALRRSVGVVGQRTELLAGTLRDNITLFGDVPDDAVARAVDALGLREWVAGLPDGLQTQLGPDGVTLSAGEEQLVSVARLLVRDVRVVVLDEATARMDPVTAQRVTRATHALLAGRTGIVVAHRLATVQDADTVAVIHGGRLVEHGPWDVLAAADGHFARLLEAADVPGEPVGVPDGPDATGEAREPALAATPERGRALAQAVAHPPAPHQAAPGGVEVSVRLAGAVGDLLRSRRRWWAVNAVTWWWVSLLSVNGVVLGVLWAWLVDVLGARGNPSLPAACLVAALAVRVALPRLLAGQGTRLWWDASMRLRLAVLRGQTGARRLRATPPGEVTARAMEDWRLLEFAHAWPGLVTDLASLAVLGLVSRSWVAVGIGALLVVVAGAASVVARRVVTRAAREAGDARAAFGRLLGSAFDAVRTVKLAAATGSTLDRLAVIDARRVRASLVERRTWILAGLVPDVVVQAMTVVAWSLLVAGAWTLPTAILVTTAVPGFGAVGASIGRLVSTAPSARRWVDVAGGLAGAGRIGVLPRDVDVVAGTSTLAEPVVPLRPLGTLRLSGWGVVHDDGGVAVRDVDLTVRRGELVLVVGQVGAGKSSLLAALAGLRPVTGRMTWNDEPVDAPHTFLRPPHVAYVGQVPRVVSGSFAENVHLDHPDRDVDRALAAARLDDDVATAGGTHARVGHRGLQLSGGQVQRLALARALASSSELLVVDDVSSALDPATEAALWDGLLAATGGAGTGPRAIVGTTSRRATLRRAHTVLVLERGRPVAVGRWSELEPVWGRLAT